LIWWGFDFERRAEILPTIELLIRTSKRMPVLIYEHVKVKEYFRFFKRYKKRLIFLGNMKVLCILQMGIAGYWYLLGTKYGSIIESGLWEVLSSAKLDDGRYRISEWMHRNGRLIMHVTREI